MTAILGLISGLFGGSGGKILGGVAVAAIVAVAALVGVHLFNTRDAAIRATAVQAQQLDLAQQANAHMQAALATQQQQAQEAAQAAASAAGEIGAAEATVAALRQRIARDRASAGQDGPAAPVLRRAVQGAWDAIEAHVPAAAGKAP